MGCGGGVVGCGGGVVACSGVCVRETERERCIFCSQRIRRDSQNLWVRDQGVVVVVVVHEMLP